MGNRRFTLLLLVLLAATISPGVSRANHDVFTNGGYTVIDSTEEGGPAYDFVDITATGTVLSLPDDGGEFVDLPFTFTYFGEEVTNVGISSNGVLGFAGELPDFGGGQQAFPDYEPPNGLLAGFWTDLDPSQGGVVAYQALGEEPNRTFVVMYKDVPHWRMIPAGVDTTPEVVTFEIVLYESSTKAVVQMKDVVNDKPGLEPVSELYVVGLEDYWGYRGLTYAYGNELDYFERTEVAVAFEQTEQEPPPPPPVEPIVTDYAPPFIRAGENHTSGTNGLPDRHASASGSASEPGSFRMAGEADSTLPTAHRFASYALSNTWHQVSHSFDPDTSAANVTVKFRLDEFFLEAGGQGALGGFSNVAAWLRGSSGRCAYGWDISPVNDSCANEIFSMENDKPGHRGTYLPAPKEFVMSFDLYDPQSYGSALYFGLTGYAQADGVQGAGLYRTSGQVIGVTITENPYSCDPYYGCVIGGVQTV